MLYVSPGPRRSTFRYSQSGMCSPKPFNAHRFEPNTQRMQTAPAGTYSGMLHCAGGILKNEGPFAFYKVSLSVLVSSHMVSLVIFFSRLQGTLTPLLGIGLCVSIQFAGLEYSKRIFSARNIASGKGDGPLTGSQYFAAGVIAGLANSVVSGPVEHIRIRRSFLFRDDRRNIPSFYLAPQPRFTRLLSLPQVCRPNQIKSDFTPVRGMPSKRFTLPAGSPGFTKDKSRPFTVKPVDMEFISGPMKNLCRERWLKRESNGTR